MFCVESKINSQAHSRLKHRLEPARKNRLALEHEDARNAQRTAQALVAPLDGRRAHLIQDRGIHLRLEPSCTRVSDPRTHTHGRACVCIESTTHTHRGVTCKRARSRPARPQAPPRTCRCSRAWRPTSASRARLAAPRHRSRLRARDSAARMCACFVCRERFTSRGSAAFSPTGLFSCFFIT